MSQAGLNSERPPCKTLQVGSAFLIWDANDVIWLREQRICGKLTGTTAKNAETLPLRLLFEEVRLLTSKGMAQIVRYKPDMVLPSSDAYRKAYEQWRQLDIDRQSSIMHEKQIQGRLANAHRIAYARKVKSKSTISDGEPAAKMPKLSEDQGDTGTVTVTPEELAAVEEEIRATPLRLLKETEMIKEVWIDSPLFSGEEQFEPVDADLTPKTEIERLRYAVFTDLWEKGYYLTDGIKFGCDFLAYPGDPIHYHASHIVVCLPPSVTYDSVDIASIGRLGSQVKKIVLLCSWDEHDKTKVRFRSLKWERLQDDKSS